MEIGKEKERKKERSSYWLYFCGKCYQSPPTLEMEPEEKQLAYPNSSDVLKASQKKPGGWRAMPFILGNETFERLATFGMAANFMVYLLTVYHMEQVSAANVLNIWSGITNFAPLVGAFISDAYIGRFKTIAVASFAAFLGMVTLTLTSWLPHLHPPKCPSGARCKDPTSLQLGVLFVALGFLSIGTGGIRPCSIPFGVDQFDPSTEEGRKGITSFYNWYYATFSVVIVITLTLIIYIQQSVSWVLGFGIPTVCMFCSIVLFFIGTTIYVHVKPEGSIFTRLAQVFVAAYKKRKFQLTDDEGVLYDPPLKGFNVITKLLITDQFSYLNKAAMIQKEDLNPDGTPTNKWKLSTIQQVEEVKCLIRIIPIWASGIVSLTAMTQQMTFTISQALIMDRHIGPKFQMPPASIIAISMLTIVVWLPFYDRILVPALTKITKQDGGITMLQRMGIGIFFSILSMVVAGLIEKTRREFAISHPKDKPMSIFWLCPQLVLMGLAEAFNAIGQIEFYNRQFPEYMTSVANALFSCSFGGASYLSSLVIVIVHRVTGTKDHPNWLANNLNDGRLDYFYYVLAVMGALNSIYFLYCARGYRYKGNLHTEEEKYHEDVEKSSQKIVT